MRHCLFRKHSALFLGVLLLGVAGWSAEESTPFSTTTLTCDVLEFHESENLLTATGHAVLISSATRLEADRLNLNTDSRQATAQGHAVLSSSATRVVSEELYLDEASRQVSSEVPLRVEEDALRLWAHSGQFNWGTSTATLHSVYLEDPPWRLWGRKVWRLSPVFYRSRRAAFTSCDEDPPHYHFRALSARFRPHDRVTGYHTFFCLGDLPLFYFPVATHSLKKHLWTLHIDPGYSATKGYYTKTIFTYPFTPQNKGRILWDYYEKAGSGWGGEWTALNPDHSGTLYAYRIRDRVDQAQRWTLRGATAQRLSSRWSLQANGVAQSDENFNNQYFFDDDLRVRQSVESDLSVAYSHPSFFARLGTEHDRVFSASEGRFVTQQTVAPRLSLQTSPLKLPLKNTYLTGQANVAHTYTRPTLGGDLKTFVPEKDMYRQTGDGSLRLSHRWQVTRHATLEPSATLAESWSSWQDLGLTRDSRDVWKGSGQTGLSLRQRLGRRWDLTASYRYQVRFRPNTLIRDHATPDRGIAAHDLGLSAYAMRDRSWLRLQSGYDFRVGAGLPTGFDRQRITPPSLEWQWRGGQGLSVYWTERWQVDPAFVPQSRSVSFRWEREPRSWIENSVTYIHGVPGSLALKPALAWPFTQKWYVSAEAQCAFKGDRGLRYERVKVQERSFRINRDMHCWQMRISYMKRVGLEETQLRLELTTQFQRRVPAEARERQYYPGREETDR